MKIRKLVLSLSAALALSACGNSDMEVSSNSYDGEWPFTVNSGVVKCINDNGTKLAVFESEGTEYQLNGAAKSRGYTDISTIWKDNPDIPGTKISVGPMIQLALSQCD